MYLNWVLVILSLLIIAGVILMAVLLTQNNQIPEISIPYGRVLTQPYSPGVEIFPVTVYLPLRNLDRLADIENQAINSGVPLTIEQIRQNFAPDSTTLSKCLAWLQEYGNVWVTDSQTTAILQLTGESLSKMVNRSLYFDYGFPFTQNQPFQGPYGMKLSINSVYDPKAERKTLLQTTQQYNLINYDNQVKSSDYYDINQIRFRMGITGDQEVGTIGLLVGSRIDREQMAKECQETGYPAQQFNDNIAECYLTFNSIAPGLIEPQFQYMGQGGETAVFNTPDEESNLDCFTCCAMRPNGKVMAISYNTNLYDNTFVDPAPILWLAEPKVFSCSYGAYISFDLEYRNRAMTEGRLLSLTGKCIFCSSGDQGLTTLVNGDTFAQYFDIARPDNSYHLVNGAITVGGFSVDMQQGKQGFSAFLPMQFSILKAYPDSQEYYTLPFSTGGGFSRGVIRPEYKNLVVTEYLATKLWKSASFANGNNGIQRAISRFEFDPAGEAEPDLCNFGNLKLGDLKIGGTSFSSPLTASMFQIIIERTGKSLISLQKQIYTKLTDQLQPMAVGNNGIFNINGYQSNLTTSWDPVNGKGFPIFTQLLNYYS